MRRGRLYRKYAVYLVGAVCVALIASSTDIYFTQHELRARLAALQQDKALSASDKIQQFIDTVEQQTDWLASLPAGEGSAALRLEAERLLRQVPAISHVRLVGADRRERLFVSRFELDRIDSGQDLATDPAVETALSGRIYFSPIYFRKETEPYMTIGLRRPHPDSGVVLIDVNLKAIWGVISPIKVGESGYAYAVDQQGTLLAHRDVSLVLRGMNVASLPQVKTALADASGSGVALGRNLAKARVFSTYMKVPRLDWIVFVEQPLIEADAPVYAAIWRTIGLLVAGLALAFAVSLVLARRMVRPIEALQSGAERLAGGALDHRIAVHSGDELEALADQFNRMAAKLQESYATLEGKVVERTRELADSNQANRRFIAAASHDLRQPLHALGLLISSLRSKTDPREIRAMVERVETAIESMMEMLDSLLDLSRLDADLMQPNIRDFPISLIFEPLTFDLGTEARGKGLDFRVVKSNVVVRSDLTMLSRIVLNLVGNAIRYTPRGKVLVGCRRRGDRVQIEVRDTGVGIAAEMQSAIFREFVKVTGPAPATRGLGLGLFIVKRLADLLGHAVDVHSTPERGSTFVITVPLGDAAAVGAAAEAAEFEFSDGLDGRSVLVVDDDPLVLDAMQRLLGGWGCDVTVAHNIDDAQARMRQYADQFDILICDYSLGAGQTGLEFLDALRGSGGAPGAMVLITGDTDVDVLKQASAAGYRTLHKPVRPARLRSLLSHLLSPAQHPAPTA